MSGIEALGVLASIAQLLEFSLKLGSLIDEVYNRVKDAPQTVTLHTAHIKQLVETAGFTKGHSEFQNPIVHTQVKATLTEAENLHQILERMLEDYTKGSSKKRVWKALVGRNERRMIASLDRLEKEKSALILCIGFAHAETLSTIRDSVGELIPRIDSMDREFTALSRRFPGGKKHRARGKYDSPPRQERQVADFTNVAPSNRDLVVRDTPLVKAEKYKSAKKNRQRNDSTKTRVIINPVTEGYSTMVCGDFQTGATKNLLVESSESRDDSLLVCGHWGASGDHKSVSPRSSGRTIIINGNVGASSTAKEVFETIQTSKNRA